jgi:oxalate decarboxylase
MSAKEKDNSIMTPLSRRNMLTIGSALGGALLARMTASAQTTTNTRGAEKNGSSNDPGPENKVLQTENPNSNTPPPTDHGDVESGPGCQDHFSFAISYGSAGLI